MVATIPFSYINTTNAAGGFTTQTEGLVQGTFMDDPATRYALRSGVIASNEALPMWGGVGIYEYIPQPTASNPVDQLGSIIGRATKIAYAAAGDKVLSGFAMFNQTHNAVVSTQSNVPLAVAGMTYKYVRLGSGNRIVVACDPSMVGMEGGNAEQPVSWDFNNQCLQPFDASTSTYALTSMTFDTGNGGEIVVVAAVATLVGGVGDMVNISGATTGGTGGNAAVNGNFVVTAFTDNQHFTLAAPGTSAYYGTIAGSPVINAGIGQLPCRIDYFLGNSMTVSYNQSTGFGSWNYNGIAAQITI